VQERDISEQEDLKSDFLGEIGFPLDARVTLVLLCFSELRHAVVVVESQLNHPYMSDAPAVSCCLCCRAFVIFGGGAIKGGGVCLFGC